MLAEDRDGFQDEDGAPELDNDGDGRADADDKCPGDPETVNGFQDEDGCPDEADRDSDGVKDPSDACAADAEDLDGFEDTDGCPDADNDKDGVADATDRCPLVVGIADNGGCPDTDRDGDGVVDRLDNCPDKRGQVKFQGCPERQLVSINANNIVLLELVYFKTDRDVIQRRSYRLLDNVAEVVNAHSEVTQVIVEGHTDAQGDEAHNLDLSQRRAAAVVAYLVSKGVDARRLVAKGYGAAQPVADNGTAKGRAQNRRVDFKLGAIAAPAAGNGNQP
jgi:outer membrane protein OmpA-like peptidoglycan-associated protein